LEKNFRKKGKLQQRNITNDFTFWHDQDKKIDKPKINADQQCFYIWQIWWFLDKRIGNILENLLFL